MPGGPGIRVDSHVYNNYFVPPHYDSLIGKLIAYGDTREQAIARMVIALSETAVARIQTNLPLHVDLMQDAAFFGRGHEHPSPGTKTRQVHPGGVKMAWVSVALTVDAGGVGLSDALLRRVQYRSR